MYINKVIFMEWDEVEDLQAKYGSTVIHPTDYNTNEIIGSALQDLMADLEANPDEYDFTKKELTEDLNNTLGTDVVKMLLNDELDFILVV